MHPLHFVKKPQNNRKETLTLSIIQSLVKVKYIHVVKEACIIYMYIHMYMLLKAFVLVLSLEGVC